jgi:hypothetical protein
MMQALKLPEKYKDFNVKCERTRWSPRTRRTRPVLQQITCRFEYTRLTQENCIKGAYNVALNESPRRLSEEGNVAEDVPPHLSHF